MSVAGAEPFLPKRVIHVAGTRCDQLGKKKILSVQDLPMSTSKIPARRRDSWLIIGRHVHVLD